MEAKAEVWLGFDEGEKWRVRKRSERESEEREREEVKGLRKESSGECVNSLREKMKRERGSERFEKGE